MSHYTVLACPACGGKANLSTDTRSATCEYCGNQLILDDRFASKSAPEPSQRQRPIAPRVAGISINATPEGVEIARRWFHPRYIFLGVFCLFWDGFLLFWYGSGFLSGAPVIFLLFPLIHVAVGAALTYSTLAGFVNTSYIDLTRESIRIQHAPLPYPGSKILPAADLRQLYTQQISRRTKNGVSISYTLSAVTRDGQKVDLLKDLDSPEASLFIEQQVEEYYRISDQPVAGEMSR
jgi:DNA-directed RNA polymerase subunit RPC12/RpoP